MDSDRILEKAPDGLLPAALRPQFVIKTNDVIDGLLFDSRQMVVSYQQRLDAQVAASTKQRSRNTLNNLYALISLSIFTMALLIWGLISFTAQYKSAKKILKDEAEALSLAELKLTKAESTVKTLEELNISKNNFISTVNHELRTPLTSIIGYVDLLKTLDINKDAEQLKKITTVIDRNSEVLLEIIESILSLSSLDSPAQMPLFEKIDLPQIIERKIFVLQPLIEQKMLVVNLNYDHTYDFAVVGNTSQISQVVLNLLSNAIKFSPERGVIDINLSVQARDNAMKYVHLEIKDHGIGIPKDEIPKLFTRFFRASNAVSSQVVGTGLGLAIVGRILDLHKGTVRVESEVNKGSTFIVEIPAYISDIDNHISKNRANVLFKAIAGIKESSPNELADICHQMSGALGFYELENEMNLISDLQNWLEENSDVPVTLINSKKDELISNLEGKYVALENIEEMSP
jgi:signal transduction histidine kinase